MNSEIKQCQNCKQNFTIEPEDFDFYEKIQVPPPTFCPKCRLQRRLAFFGLFNLYKRPCDLCKKEMITTFKPESPYVVYCPKCWWSDDWSPFDYGREYDFSKPFLEQFKELWHQTPVLGVSLDPSDLDSPYNNHCGHLKNCYLLFHADFVEDSTCGFYLNSCKSVLDCGPAILSELCYDSMHSYKNNRCIGLRSQVTESIDCAFLKDCMNCQNCFASANLRNKKYHIFNKPYSKEGYLEELKKWDLGSYKTYQEIKKLAKDHWNTLPPKPHMEEFNTNCSGGSHIFQSKNCKDSFETVGAEDSRYLLMVQDPPIRDCYDVSSWGNNIARCYEGNVIGENVSDVKFCQETGINLLDAEYSKLSTGGGHHFGCVSIKKGEYCILNKKYSKEDYEALTAKIREHMNAMPYVDKRGIIYKYGEFFPVELSPFGYNETIANNFFPLLQAEVESSGFRWSEPEIRTYSITKKPEELPDHIKEASDSILNETIGCAECGKGFRITPMELLFLRNMNLPLPRRCPFCRIDEKFNQWVKNLRVIDRVCDKCGVVFTTNYTKDEVPHILCKACYLKEVI